MPAATCAHADLVGRLDEIDLRLARLEQMSAAQPDVLRQRSEAIEGQFERSCWPDAGQPGARGTSQLQLYGIGEGDVTAALSQLLEMIIGAVIMRHRHGRPALHILQDASASSKQPVPNGAASAPQRLPDSVDGPRTATANENADSGGRPAWQDAVPGATQQRLATELTGHIGSCTCFLSAKAVSGISAAGLMRPAHLDEVLL